MNRIVAHLNRCLGMHSCVLLPGLGGFVAVPIAARYDATANLAYPPYEELRFNASLSYHDGILEESYAQSYGISHRRARVMLDEDVRRLRAELLHNGKISLDRIGTLSLNEEGRISFTPSQQADYISIAYGLTPCSLPFLKEQAVIEELKPALQPEIYPHSLDRNKNYFYIKLPKKTTAVAASVLLALFISLLPFKQIPAPKQFSASFVPSEITASKLWSRESDKASTAGLALDAAKPTADGLVADPSTLANTEDATMPVLNETSGEKHYYVILATFSNKASANSFCKDIKCQEKVADSFLLIGKSKVRVVADRFDNATDAYNYAKDLAKKYPQFKSSWVYETR